VKRPCWDGGDVELGESTEDEPSQTSIHTLSHPPPNTIMRISSDLRKDPDPGKDDETELTDTRN
jgi:hypothetical protein